MSLTSYRAAPPRGGCGGVGDPAWWPGGDLLFRRLSDSTMGAEVFHGRVRDGIGCIILAMATGPPGRILWCVGVGCCGCVCVGCGLVLRAGRGVEPWPVRWWWGDEICWAIRTA